MSTRARLLLLLAIGTVAIGFTYNAVRTRDEPQQYASAEVHFLYGSIGSAAE
ncbi:MAG: hypothetical protein HOH95_00340, partial [Dehalococcoidia bacterium]|nr:hypothetical protein [Dehalococcoidia bacterium]